MSPEKIGMFVIASEDEMPVAPMPEALPPSPWGIIGKFQMASMYRLQCNLTVDQRAAWVAAVKNGTIPKLDDSVLPPTKASAKNPDVEQSWCSFYYYDIDQAHKLATWINENTTLPVMKSGERAGEVIYNKPTRVHRRVVEIASILDEDQRERVQKRAGEGAKTFGWDTFIQAPDWKSNRRYVSQLIDLPAFVAAAARAMGENVSFDLSSLLERVDEERDPYTKDYEKTVVGNLDAAYLDYDCVLGQQRIALWNALGEDKHTRYEIVGTKDSKGQLSKYAVTSAKLNQCLKIYYRRTTDPVWLELAEVNDPRVTATREGTAGDGTTRQYRERIAVVVRFFANEDEAKKVVEQRTVERDDEAEETGSKPIKDTKPDYPASIGGSGKVYKNLQTQWDKDAKGMTDEALRETFEVTDDELSMWRTYWG